jgi:peptidoglycan hydrolase-like protein with peptidoglycan-binding domain
VGQLDREGIPLKLFEAYRYPQRQHELYQQGRIDDRPKVTYQDAWGSFHQYGVAVDFVIFENGQWSWERDGHRAQWWERLHEIGRANGLEPLSWETPHLQLIGTSSAALYRGDYPPDGDLAWATNLNDAISNWHGSPGPPPRPPLPTRPQHDEEAAEPLAAAALSARIEEAPDETLQSPLLSSDATLQAIVGGAAPALRQSQQRRHTVALIQAALEQIALADAQSGISLHLDDAHRGYFGPRTARAVRRFQVLKALEPDIVVGKNTLLALDRALIGVPVQAPPARVAAVQTPVMHAAPVEVAPAPTPTYRNGPVAQEFVAAIPLTKAETNFEMDTYVGLVKGTFRVFPSSEARFAVISYESKFTIDGDGSGGAHPGDVTFQSDTNLHNADGSALNSKIFPFAVLPQRPKPPKHTIPDLGAFGVKLGDLGIAFWRKTKGSLAWRAAAFVYGDIGPQGKIGEGSIYLADLLGMPSSPASGGFNENELDSVPGVLHLAFPGSRDRLDKLTNRTAQQVEIDAWALFSLWLTQT